MMSSYLLVSRFMGVNEMRKKEEEREMIIWYIYIKEFRRNTQYNQTYIESQSKWSHF